MIQATDVKFLRIFETADSDYTSQLDLHFIENLTIWEGDKIEKKSKKRKMFFAFLDILDHSMLMKTFKSLEILLFLFLF